MNQDLLVGMLGNAIWLLIGVSVSFAIRIVRHRAPARGIWGLKPDGRVTIVITKAELRDESEHTDLVYPAEARAAGEVESFLVRLYPKIRPRVTLSDAVPPELLRDDLVIIGGPVYNKITRQVLGHFPSIARFDGYQLVMAHDTWLKEAKLDDDGRIAGDVGLVMIAPNPWNPSRRAIVLCGSRTYGCLAASRAMVRSDVARTRRAVGAERLPYAFGVTADVDQSEVFDVKVDPASVSRLEAHSQ